MVQMLRSANGESKTGVYSCKAGGAVTAGNIVKITTGGTRTANSGNTIASSTWCVTDITASDSGNLVFGIAKQTATTTSGTGSTPGDVEVVPICQGDIVLLPYGTVGSVITNAPVVGDLYQLSEATSSTFDTQTILLYAASPVTELKCFRVLAVDTTNGYCEAQYVGATTVA